MQVQVTQRWAMAAPRKEAATTRWCRRRTEKQCVPDEARRSQRGGWHGTGARAGVHRAVPRSRFCLISRVYGSNARLSLLLNTRFRSLM